MNGAAPWLKADWSFAELDLVDEVCDQFEAAWVGKDRPSLESCLAAHPDLPRSLLLYELLKVELELRRRVGERPGREEYEALFGQDRELLERFWGSFGSTRSQAVEPEDTSSYAPRERVTRIPATLGRFSIRRVLGRGGFGTVYLADDPQGEQPVALKVLHSDFLSSPRRREEFREEARTGKSLDHPHLVKTLGIEELGDHLCIVQEYIEGANLAAWCEQRQCTPDQMVELLIPVAEALAYLHERQYVHRDLKPANILVDQSGVPYVSDFGLAIHEEHQRSRRGEFAGTRAYMSPEQVRGQTELIDGRSDIWSLGVILYHLLTNRLPFGGPPPRRSNDDWEAYYRDLDYEIQEHDPRPLRHIRPDLSRRLEEICLRCLEKRQRNRFQTGHDLAEEFRLYRNRSASRPGAVGSPRGTRIVPRGLRSFDQADAGFFLELLPGPRTSEGLPASVSFWLNRLPASELARPLEVGVLYGPSGSGKSSLVKAGILPRLGPRFLPLLVEATEADTERRLREALRRAVPQLPPDASLAEASHWIGAADRLDGRCLLLVIDQFEQWLYGNPQFRETELVETLRHCNGTRLQALLLVRDDFWMPLSRLMERLELGLQEGSNAAAVDLFGRDHARKVLSAFGQAYQRLDDDPAKWSDEQRQFLDRAVDGLSEAGRVVCVRLAVFAEMMKDRPWTLSELERIGGAKGVGVALLEEKLGSQAPAAYRPHRAAARRVLSLFLPTAGSRIKGQFRTLDALREEAGYSQPRDFLRLMEILDGDLKLITPSLPEERLESPAEVPDAAAEALPEESALPSYQLTHDFLVPALREWLNRDLRRTRRGRALLQLQERAADWQRRPEPRQLPSFAEWLAFVFLVPGRKRSATEQRMLSVAGRRFARHSLLLICVLLGFGIGAGWGAKNWEVHAYLGRVLGARTSEVPGLAADMPWPRSWVLGLLQGSHDRDRSPSDGSPEDAKQRASRFQRLVNVSLALAQEDPSRLDPVLDGISQVPLEDLEAMITMLGGGRPGMVEPIREGLESALQSRPADVLPLAAVLAGLAPEDPALVQAAPELARGLRDARPTQFPLWLGYLRPAAPAVLPELVTLWRAEPAPEGRPRGQLADALAEYARGNAEALVLVLEDATAEEFALFRPRLQEIPDQAVPALERRLQVNRHAALRPDAPLDAPEPGETLVRDVREVGGLLTPYDGFALAVPRGQVDPLCHKLATEGYRPLSVRPFTAGQSDLATVAWTRDARPFLVATDLSQDQLREALATRAAAGFAVVDVAWGTGVEAGPGDKVRWSAVWVRRTADDPPVEYFLEETRDAVNPISARLQREGYCLLTNIIRDAGEDGKRYTSIWARYNPSRAEQQRSDQQFELTIGLPALPGPRWEDAYGDLFPGAFQTDLRVDWALRKPAPPSSAPPSSAPSSSPRSTPAAPPPPPDPGDSLSAANRMRLYSWVSQSGTRCGAVSRQYLRESAEALLARAPDRFAAAYSPVVLEPSSATDRSPVLYASVWHRRVQRPVAAERNARQRANLVIALASLGRVGELEQLLDSDDGDRDPRSWAIIQLARCGFPVEQLVGVLNGTNSVSSKYACLLALGHYPPGDIPPATMALVRSWALQAPEAAVRSAAAWCGQQWGLPDLPGDPSSPPRGINWYLNAQQQMMIILEPAEFRLGSSNLEPDRGESEQQIWTRIDRRFSLSATPVTVRQYRRFLADPDVRKRLPPELYKVLAARASFSETTWHLDCPQAGLDRLAAMLFCEWLSEQDDRIASDQRCYPDIWDYVRKVFGGDQGNAADDWKFGYRPQVPLLDRTGYRLPTEAEWEYAARAGSDESRFFGDSDRLLEGYVWYRDNADGRSHPVGHKMPNLLGFFDTLGNVSQYCCNLYRAYSPPGDSYIRDDTVNLFAESEGWYALRGGDFDSPPREVRSANRSRAAHDNNRYTHGFRVARTEAPGR